MSYEMWEWECSGCGEVFRGGTKEAAENQFLEHARETHNPKLLVSFNASEEVSADGQ